jgi:hypothetical protein
MEITWAPTECVPGSELNHFDSIVTCHVGKCSRRGELRFKGLQDRDRVLSLRRPNVMANATRGVCVMHRSGQWLDRDSGRAVVLTSSMLRARAEMVERRLPSLVGANCSSVEALLSRPACDPAPLSALDALAVLHVVTTRNGTSSSYVLFTGDSIVRQLHARLVQIIRGIPPPIMEQTSLGEVTYAASSTGDLLVVRSRYPRRSSSSKSPRGAARGKGVPLPSPWLFELPEVTNWLVRFDFSWQATINDYKVRGFVRPPWEQPDATRLYLYPTPRYHLHAFMYWNGNDFSEATLLQSHQSKLDDMVNGSSRGTGDDMSLVFITTPPLETGSGYSTSNPPLNEFFVKRNTQLARWVASRGNGSTLDLLLLDFAAIVTNSDGDTPKPYDGTYKSQRKDDKHFMCTADPKLPDHISLIRQDENGCLDTMNARLVQRLLVALLLRRRLL